MSLYRCKRGHDGPYGSDGRCLACRRERERVPADKKVARRKAKTYEGKACGSCNNTLRYESNGGCVHCSNPRNKKLLKPREAAAPETWPTRVIMIRRPCRLPLQLEIPAPPLPPILHQPWSAVA